MSTGSCVGSLTYFFDVCSGDETDWSIFVELILDLGFPPAVFEKVW